MCVQCGYGAEHNGHMSKSKIHKIQLADSFVLPCEYVERICSCGGVCISLATPNGDDDDDDAGVMTGKFHLEDINNTVYFE